MWEVWGVCVRGRQGRGGERFVAIIFRIGITLKQRIIKMELARKESYFEAAINDGLDYSDCADAFW